MGKKLTGTVKEMNKLLTRKSQLVAKRTRLVDEIYDLDSEQKLVQGQIDTLRQSRTTAPLLNAYEVSLIAGGEWLAAIKALRQRGSEKPGVPGFPLGLGLREAKDIVDEYRNKIESSIR